MKLTKSLFLTFLESPLHMWLSVHGSTAPKPPSLYEQHLQSQGYAVEQEAKAFLRLHVASNYPKDATITFEQTLTDGNYQSRIDAMVHNPQTNTYDLYEIKSSTSVHSDHKHDLSFQHLVAKASLPIHKAYLVHLDGEYRRAGELELSKLFVVQNMTETIGKLQDDTYQLRLEAWDTLRLENEPSDQHCFNPSTCPFPDHCFPNLPEGSIYELGRANKNLYLELLEMGVTLLKDIPDTLPTLSAKQRLQIQSARLEKPIIDHQAVAQQLKKLEYPLYFLDFETYAEAIPLFQGYKPYQQAVTQFSVHVVEHPETEADVLNSSQMKHFEYLATEPTDPACDLASELCKVIGETGSVIVWFKGFECGRNQELAELCPDLAERLHGINSRVFDLMEIFSNGLYMDHRFRGSSSIKKVLPVICPELSYKELEIGEGTKAMLAWNEMVFGDLTEEENEKIRANLLEYCKLDTRAMVEIWRGVEREVIS